MSRRGEDVTRTRLTIWEGVGQIGGTKITVEADGFRLLFDWGTIYEPGGTFWSDKIRPRSDAAGLRDLLWSGDLPPLDGIYPDTWAAEAKLQPPDGKTVLFLSHLHKDHIGALPWLDNRVPTYLHPDSLRMLQVLVETGEEPVLPGGLRPLAPGETIEHGPLRFRLLEVDHDIPGAAALLIETPDGAVVYTGDLRYHGLHPENVDAFVQAAKALNPKILLIEGTTLFPPDPEREAAAEARRAMGAPPPRQRGEADVPERVAQLIGEHKGLAMIALYPRNTERITGIVEAAAHAARRLILRPATAALWAAMGGDLSHVGLWVSHDEWTQLKSGGAPDWLARTVEGAANRLSTERLRGMQREILLEFELAMLPEIVELGPVEDSVMIHSNGEPLGPFDPNWEILQRWLLRMGIPLRWAGCSGHAKPEDLVRIAQEINPAILMPIHSKHPELFEVEGMQRILPTRGSTYSVATGEEIERRAPPEVVLKGPIPKGPAGG